MNMLVNEDDVQDIIKRKCVFDDNMHFILELVNGIHNRIYDVQDFHMVIYMSCYRTTHLIA